MNMNIYGAHIFCVYLQPSPPLERQGEHLHHSLYTHIIYIYTTTETYI